MPDYSKPWCYMILADQYDENGYIPSAVFEGEAGHHPMTGATGDEQPWYWGTTYEEAVETCKEANAARGITPERAAEIVTSSMMMSRTGRR